MSLLAIMISAVSLVSAGAANHEGLTDRESIQWTENVARPHVGTVTYGTIINHCKSPGLIALAFDDGPWVFTNQLLDLLDQLGVQATFFVTGYNLGKGRIDDCKRPWPSIMYRMYDSGQQIASHTWTHQNLDRVNHKTQETEIIYNEMAFRTLFGWFPSYVRPPYLECTAKSGCQDLLGNLGYHIITSNVDTKDYLNDSPSQIQKSKDIFAENISKESSKNSYIVLAHDTHNQTATNLTAFMVQVAKDRGYKLVTVGECLGDPKENWYRSVRNGRYSCKSTGGSVIADSSMPAKLVTTIATAPTSTTGMDPTSTQWGPSAQTKAASPGVELASACLRYICLGVIVFVLGMRVL
ncbi:chitin deacetylase [Pochonia chlamydosporia 170]|uniref:Chitin deacetylase n=1 Tax=Pochonia chlamydosporia 170 TaxID=1380566 RepID=A0A179EY19_METCM|nr:chitin deacetylase [Pochonia chlamydosporia 170]OAQ57743.1 chitin deacetylase [Pochonia chlamydosporia 170]